MGTNTRPETQKWHVGKDRYYELVHFCRQYGEWKRSLRDIDGMPTTSIREHVDEGWPADPTSSYAELRMYYSERIDMVNKAADISAEGEVWSSLIVEAVTQGLSYQILEARHGVLPIARNKWYDVYRKFFWVLDRIRR